jgi:hypothetical protein
MERVSVILGKAPVILVCPHGADDTNTDAITELAAQQLNCYAVINRGFERDEDVDVNNDKADCNRIDHVKQDVVFDEFLRPIQRFEQKLSFRNTRQVASAFGYPIAWGYGGGEPVHLFHIHGCGNLVHKEAGEDVEVIVGYGLGIKKDCLSCDLWRKNLFVDLYRKYASDGDVFEGKKGGKYAGRDSNNMNQYFRKHEPKSWVHSMQLEYPFSARNDTSRAVTTAMMLAVVIQDYLAVGEYDKEPPSKFI